MTKNTLNNELGFILNYYSMPYKLRPTRSVVEYANGQKQAEAAKCRASSPITASFY